jgi:citrate lyase alpha subunit
MATIVRKRTRVRIQRQSRHTFQAGLAEAADLVHKLRAMNQHLRPCIADQLNQLAWRQPPVERLQDRAQLATGKPLPVSDRPVAAGRIDQGHLVRR